MKTLFTLPESELLIYDWADNKELLKDENAPKQRLKLIEEIGELSNAVLKSKVTEQKDAIGDIGVVLIILTHQKGYKLDLTTFVRFEPDTYSSDLSVLLSDIIAHSFHGTHTAFCILNHVAQKLGHDLTECINLAYDVIKNRKGQTVNGTFIKSEDL